MSLSLTFLGGAGTVTGSRFLLETPGRRILVDCGLYQGIKELRLRNWAPFPVEPGGIDAVVLTHAHLDHCGYLPLLVRQGFRGRVYCSVPTRALARILLLDAAHIQEEDAAEANRQGFSRHHPARPLFTTEDAARALQQLAPVPVRVWTDLGNGLRFRLRPSGHILGSTFVEVDVEGIRVVFSGDLGRTKPLLLEPRELIERADHLVLESTYGDREHSKEPPLESLRRVVAETLDRGGSVIVPSFAVGRTQDVLYLIHQLRLQNKIPAEVPVYVDSPMAIEATRIFGEHGDWQKLRSRGIRDLGSVASMARTEAESRSLLKKRKPKIVIAGAGMVTGGRVLRHLEKHLPDPASTVLLVGYQAPGTRGSLLKDGAKEIKMLGNYVSVRANVEEISSLSAHADRKETVAWLRGFRKAPRVYLVHGELQAADSLRVYVKDKLGWDAAIPAVLDTVELTSR